MGIEANLDTPLAAAVRAARSQSAYARLMGRSQASVYEALKAGKPMWAEDVLKVERELGIARHLSRPDLYPPEESESDNQPTVARSDNHRAAATTPMDPLP